MTIENMKSASFENNTLKDWEEKASASLKGKPLETLYTNTYEKIVLKPVYTESDINQDAGLPGEKDFRRGIHRFGYQTETWKIANRLSYHSLDELGQKLKLALSKGQTAIAFEMDAKLFADSKKLAAFLGELPGGVPFTLDAGFLQGPMLAAVAAASKKSGEKPIGFIAADPIAEAAVAGGLPKQETEFFQYWAKLLKEAEIHLPEVKTVLVNASPYHNNGANAVQELAIAISTGVYLLQKLVENGWDLKEALSKFVFHFSVGSNFFMETAKLRAARLLWSKAAEAFGAGEEDRKMTISAETSAFNKTVFDPYVNILRVGNEAFAAVLGGIQYLHTATYDQASGGADPFGERIARNTQLILKSEAHLEKVADPAGGSWYIESLTNELAEKAWALFLEVDRLGGIYETLKTGWLQSKIAESSAERKKDALRRKKSIIGTNVYANLADAPEEPAKEKEVRFFMAGELPEIIQTISDQKPLTEAFVTVAKGEFPALKQVRLAEPFEQLRFRAIKLEKETGLKPTVGLICLGELKNYKARADFISGLLAAGGIHTVRSEGLADAQGATKFMESVAGNQFVICGSNGDYAQIGTSLANDIKTKHPQAQLFLAGLPDDAEIVKWKTAGVDRFIHVKSDTYELLTSMLNEMEVAADAEA